MLHACVQRFDVTKNLEKFCKILERHLVSVTVLKISPVGMLATQGKVDALVTEVANREECWTPTGKKLAGVVGGTTRHAWHG